MKPWFGAQVFPGEEPSLYPPEDKIENVFEARSGECRKMSLIGLGVLSSAPSLLSDLRPYTRSYKPH